jgi:hypothetical protein
VRAATEEGNQTELRTTREVLDRLQRLGLSVTTTMIADDTREHYLPERETAHLGRDGASGMWEPWMERRAERLYRLRALNRQKHRGPSGNVLRLLLFIADGWGWDTVKKTCMEGYRIFVRGSMRGASNRLRRRPLTLESLQDAAYEIAEDQYRPEDPNQAQIDRVKMTIGLLKFGMAPDTKMGTIERFMDAFTPPGTDPQQIQEYKALAPLGWTLMGASESEALDILERGISNVLAERATWRLRHLIWIVRSGFRRKFTGRENDRRFQTNPLTFFGFAAHFRFNEAFRRMPIRCTPAQVLGGHVAHLLVTLHSEERMEKLAELWMKCLAYWLQSDAFKQWLEQLEREVIQSNN